jgi:hypothetical protein
MAGLTGDLRRFLESAGSGKLSPVEILKNYLDPTKFTGALFDRYGMDRSDPNTINDTDLLAVTLLSIDISLRTTRGIRTTTVLKLERNRQRIADLLDALGPDRPLHTLDSAQFERRLGDQHAAGSELYWFLRGDDIGLPRVATYKLLSRKRPQLLPIRDTVLETALHRGDDWWRAWWEELTCRTELVERLEHIRREAGAEDLSLLRIADILVWVRQRGADQIEGLRERVGPAVQHHV